MKNLWYALFLVALVTQAQAQNARVVEMQQLPPRNSFERRGVSLKEALQQTSNEKVIEEKERTGVLNVSILLPFSATSTLETVKAAVASKDNLHSLKLVSNEAKTALDFYDGVLMALKKVEAEGGNSLKLKVNFFDTWASDSVVDELLKEKDIVNADVIIGPATHEGAKKVAEFCKQNKIVNVQPFSPSKSITSDNPYHVKIAPTIDAHIDNIMRSLADSFNSESIIIYTTNASSDLSAAKRLDSLLKNFDGPGKTHFKSTLVNISSLGTNGNKKTPADFLIPSQRNVAVACIFGEANAQTIIRQLFASKPDVVIYGMPTWLNSEVLRLDYLNKLNARFTEQFFEDTASSTKAKDFIAIYKEQHYSVPAKYAYLGYDVVNWLYKAAAEDERFPMNLAGSFYAGAGYKFQFRMAEKAQESNKKRGIDYFENTFLHLLRIENYALLKDW